MRIVPTPPLPEWGLNAGGFEELFLEGRSFGFLHTAIINFTSRLLFDLQFTCRLMYEDVPHVIFHLCF